MIHRTPSVPPTCGLRATARSERPRFASPATAAALVAVAVLAILAVAAPATAVEVVYATAHDPDHGNGSWPRFLVRPTGGATLFDVRTGPFDYPACLWRTDGTAAGTVPIPGCPQILGSRFEAIVDGRLFFPALRDDAIDLWTSDGTVAGTRPLTALAPGLGIHSLSFAGADDPLRVVVFADDGVHGFEPWASDGTVEGTRVLDLTPGEESTSTGYPAIFDGKLLLPVWTGGNIELWASDFTVEGTTPIAILPASHALYSPLATVAEGVVFVTRTADCVAHLWASDGTAAGTRELGNFPNYCGASLSLRYAFVEGPTALQDHVYFLADDGLHGREIWRTDGGVLTRVSELAPDEPFADPGLFFPGVLGGRLVFPADGGPGVGTELFATDGAPESTAVVADVCPGDCSGLPRETFPALGGGKLFFAADDGVHGLEAWMTDGTVAGTRMRADVCPGSCSSVTAGGNVSGYGFVLQVASDPIHGQEVWRSELTTGAMTRLTDFESPMPFHPDFVRFVDVAHGIVFAADDGLHGLELWVTDGTAAGTRLLANLVAEPGPVTEPPPPPHGFHGLATFHGGVVDLFWEPGAGGGAVATWIVEARSPGFGWTVVSTLEGNPPLPFARLSLEDDTPYTFRVRAENSVGVSAWSAPFHLTTLVSYDEDPCATGQGLCLQGGRFLVEVDWRNQHAGPSDPASGVGVPVEATDLSGYFWFFRPDNIELVVKVLDGTSINGFYWTFYGALSDVEYWITVTDLTSLERRTYHNPPGQVCGRGDTGSIASESAGAAGEVWAEVSVAATLPAWTDQPTDPVPPGARAVAFDAAPRTVRATSHPAQPCVADAETLCLLGGRFRVRVAWTDQHNGGSGVGSALPYADRTGFFTFFNPANVELVVKALDGRAVNGKIWFFYGALSDVGYTITVDDLADGHASRQYTNAPGSICGRADTGAF